MYYSSGNYEAFARPKKPEGVDHKSAYFIGTGLAALSAECFLIRDAQMPGKNIHFFEHGNYRKYFKLAVTILRLCGICSVPFHP